MLAEYCTPDLVRQRLTSGGYLFFADENQNGQPEQSEIDDNINSAIRTAGRMIDEVLENAGCPTGTARGQGNLWLQDIAVDLAVFRVSTNGGREVIDGFKVAYDEAQAALTRIRSGMKVPGLKYNRPFPGRSPSGRFPLAINPGHHRRRY